MFLTSSRRKEIEAIAQDLLMDIYPNKNRIIPPVDLGKIIVKNGLTLKSYDFNDNTILGAFDRASNTIITSPEDSYPRKAFTIAHEIGHFVLHRDINSEYLYRRTVVSLVNNDLKPHEIEANWFASCLLMPRQQIAATYRALKDIEKTAILFGVSNAATYWRLKELHLVD